MPEGKHESKVWWWVGLVIRLVLVCLAVGLIGRMCFNGFSWWLIFFLLIGITWAIRYKLPYLKNYGARQRWLFSAGMSLPTGLLIVFFTSFVAIAYLSRSLKSPEVIESVTLASGEVLVNHTAYEGDGWDSFRINRVYLTNPKTAASELVGDFNYESEGSLFTRFPGIQLLENATERVLLIGPNVCRQRRSEPKESWHVDTIYSPQSGADSYLHSYIETNHSTAGGCGISIQDYVCASVDFSKQLLIAKRIHKNTGCRAPEFLVFALAYPGVYPLPLRLDLPHTIEMNRTN